MLEFAELRTSAGIGCPQGFEPRYADPESAVLPLNEGAASKLDGNRASLILWAMLSSVNLRESWE